MVSPILERIVIIEHTLSLVGVFLTLYFNNNPEIIFMCILNMCQHILKLIRFVIFGFTFGNTVNPIICYFHSFFNNFTLNSSLAAACLLIFTLYAAIFHTKLFTKYYKQYRFYIYAFIIIYTASYILVALYEPIVSGNNNNYIANKYNCSTGYLSKLYQYIFISSAFNLPFTLSAFIFSVIIVYKIFVLPRPSLKRVISRNTKMSFSRWIKIIFYTVCLIILSFINIYSGIKVGIRVSKGEKEEDVIGIRYIITASSGILICIFTNSFNQVRRKFGGVVQNDDSINNSDIEEDAEKLI